MEQLFIATYNLIDGATLLKPMSIKDDPRLSLLHLVLQLVLKSICVASDGLDHSCNDNQKKIFEAIGLAMKSYVEKTIGSEFGGGPTWSYSRNTFEKASDEFKVLVYAMNNDNY